MSFKKTVLCCLSFLPLCSYGIVFDLTKTTPDISVTSLTVSYDAANNLFTATGLPGNLDLGGSSNSNPIYASDTGYTLTADVDELGILGSGTFSITGAINKNGAGITPSAVLLTGDLFAFDSGLSDSSGSTVQTNTFEFRYDITGGSLASDFTSSPTYSTLKGAIIMVAEGAAFSGWTSDWSNFPTGSTPTGTLDTAITSAVPESSSLALQLGGLALLGATIRRRSV